MRKILLIATLAGRRPPRRTRASWVAVCNDGKNVQYIQTVDGVGFLYLKTDKEFYQTARLSQTSSTERHCAAPSIPTRLPAQEPVTQVCINRAHQDITLNTRTRQRPAAPCRNVGVSAPRPSRSARRTSR